MQSVTRRMIFYDIPFDRKKSGYSSFGRVIRSPCSKQPDVVMNVSAFLQTKARQGIYD